MIIRQNHNSVSQNQKLFNVKSVSDSIILALVCRTCELVFTMFFAGGSTKNGIFAQVFLIALFLELSMLYDISKLPFEYSKACYVCTQSLTIYNRWFY